MVVEILNWTAKVRLFYLILLVIAGESVFILPFVLVRVFRPTVLAVYGIDHTDIGVCFAVYGFVALGAYLFGGPLADRYPPRKLMGTALLATAAGGLVYAAVPSLTALKWLYGYWGFTTIFLFWAAMIKATRVWGGAGAQGLGFGLLDGGRGLTGALVALAGVAIISSMTGGAGTADVASFRVVVYLSSALVAFVGVVVFFFLRDPTGREEAALVDRLRWRDVKQLLRLPTVWLLMVIILCAYVGYRGTDIYSQYAKDVMGYDDVGAARAGTILLFIRPVVAVLAGVLADRSRPSLYLTIGFGLTIAGSLLFAYGGLGPGREALYFTAMAFAATGVYAGRVLYWAVMREGGIPLLLTGTAVGLVSFVGFTPDIFAGLLFGYYLDAFPGATGHRYVQLTLVGFSVVGVLATGWFVNVKTRPR